MSPCKPDSNRSVCFYASDAISSDVRTTLEIDDDVLAAAKELAARRKTTAGKMISEMARRGMHPPRTGPAAIHRNGFEILPSDGRIITAELVQKLLEESNEP